MKSLMAFMKKEWLAQFRSGRIIILGIVFVLFGVMNPAIAKLTPWMMEIMSDALAETGMAVTVIQVDAMTSWTQFYKNIPIGLIVLVVMQSSIFTGEYRSGTLVLALTKGLERYKVVVSKTVMVTALWSVYYWLCFGITYGLNAFFWDNSIAHNIVFSAVCMWLLGIWVLMLAVLFSAIMKTNIGVLMGTGGVFLGIYLISLLPKVTKYTPSMLLNGAELLTGAENPSLYGASIIVTIIMCAVCVAASVMILNKRQMS